ncbi:cold shock domain-containing protein [uncultured Winogradskyella sp.]|uniref:cold-shock protein n=1 Tax=uncultured Winogradskyella sp. TaxID=395353 RepID=UPI0030DCF5C3|tara:strand:- start:149 stop:397 length:249 start_codon:yes stop_codon:yes gene_type:complete
MIANFIKKLFGSSKATGTKEGTVKFFNYKKGFGFITLNDSEEEIFVHTTNLIDKIKENNKVTFTIEKSEKGPVATNVRVIKK